MSRPRTPAEIGIALPAWNAGLLLGDTIGDLLALLDSVGVGADIVVVDDGSTDDTVDVVRKFAGHVQLLSVPHGGVSAARNAGLAHLSNAVVTMLDADDRFAPGLLTELLPRALRKGNAAIVQGLIHDWRVEELGAPDVPMGAPYRSVNVGAAVYRAEVFRTVGSFDLQYVRHEDYDWYLRAYDLRVPKDNVDVVSLQYRRRSDGLSRTSPPGDPTLARIHGAAIRRRRAGLAPIPPGFPKPGTYFGAPPGG